VRVSSASYLKLILISIRLLFLLTCQMRNPRSPVKINLDVLPLLDLFSPIVFISIRSQLPLLFLVGFAFLRRGGCLSPTSKSAATGIGPPIFFSAPQLVFSTDSPRWFSHCAVRCGFVRRVDCWSPLSC
jgi:hypothetical protein